MSSSTPKPGAYLIFGLPGTGKTTIARELNHRGFKAIHTDADRGLSDWVDTTTGHRVSEFPDFPLPANWYKTHRWNWDADRLKQLMEDAKQSPIFICGDASNERPFFHLFRKLFALHLDSSTMKSRLEQRDSRRYNDHTPELRQTLEWNQHFLESHRNTSAIFLDASQPTTDIVDQILREAAA